MPINPSNATSLTIAGGAITTPGNISTLDNLLVTGAPISNGAGTQVAVKAANTAPLATDPSLVVSYSPNCFGQQLMAASISVVLASNQSAIDVIIQQGVQALWDTGTSNNGLLVSEIVLIAADLNGVTSTSFVVSTLSGALGNGVISTIATGGAIWAELFLTVGSFTPTATGACLSGWFLPSPDGGTTFEIGGLAANGPPPRPPDWTIPLPTSAISSTTGPYKATAMVQLPSMKFKIGVQNNTGATLAASGMSLGAACVAPVS